MNVNRINDIYNKLENKNDIINNPDKHWDLMLLEVCIYWVFLIYFYIFSGNADIVSVLTKTDVFLWWIKFRIVCSD